MIIGKGLIRKFYKLKFKQLPPSFDKKRIVFLTDLHGKSYGYQNESLLAMIRESRPNYILVGGDNIVGGMKADGSPRKESVPSIQVSLNLLEKLVRDYPVYYAMGNHEEKLEKSLLEEYNEGLGELGVKRLDNEAVEIFSKEGESLNLYGLSLEKKFYPKLKKERLEVQNIVQKIGEKEGFSILLAHSPFYFKTYMEWGADLVLSGHLHGGIMRLPLLGGMMGPDLFPFPRYSGGVYEKEGKKMLVSCGLGTHTINLRIFNPPELTVIELESGEKRNGN